MWIKQKDNVMWKMQIEYRQVQYNKIYVMQNNSIYYLWIHYVLYIIVTPNWK